MLWHFFTGRLPGRARQLYPGISDFDLLCHLKGIVALDAKVPHRALNFLVPKKQLPIAEAIDLVGQAGGVAAWAHPIYDATWESLTELAGLGLGAVETPGRKAVPRRR